MRQLPENEDFVSQGRGEGGGEGLQFHFLSVKQTKFLWCVNLVDQLGFPNLRRLKLHKPIFFLFLLENRTKE